MAGYLIAADTVMKPNIQKDTTVPQFGAKLLTFGITCPVDFSFAWALVVSAVRPCATGHSRRCWIPAMLLSRAAGHGAAFKGLAEIVRIF